eukprot:CAMPEP_0113464040 /NCGR_PEP_ID=MMETSP0014_2-20120614/12983_1 /TAXON_ID=2857 /ORGANISM="Nitzschia sp." /LENGTH=645 /DNA_ID=CAMNT_0000356083 /DNA_START=156 /DNA_END=2093 /DNA_ORIENTATION=- /assembly_acc=CAM_ASM_000159
MRFGLPAIIALAAFAYSTDAFSVNSFGSHVMPSTSSSMTQLHAEASKVFMPALSSTMKEGKVVTWLKEEGDEIEAGEAIMVVESDKADMDVEAFEDGFLAKIIVGEGEVAPVGEAVALIAASADEIDAVAAGGAGDAAATAAPAAAAEAPAAPAADASAGAPDVEFSQVDMPALSSTMKEGKVVSWLKAEGDPISAGEAIMVVESDKADMDVEAFEDGFLAAIITEEGDATDVGSPVALIAAEESDIPALQAYAASLSGAPAAAAPAASAVAAPAAVTPKAAAPAAAKAPGARVVASPLAKKKAEELGIDISTVAGTGPDGRITASDVEAAASGSAPAASKPAAAAPTKPSWTPAAGVIAATPMARAAAKKAKIDLATIQGTGEFGRVTVDDVKMATGEKQPERKRVASGGEPVVDLPDGFVPFSGMQKAVSNNMVATLTVPSFQVTTDIEMGTFEAMYQKLKPEGVSVSAMLAKAVALAIEKHPILNSAYTDQDGGGIMFKKDINIAMAVAIDGGLITPTLMYANERPVKEIADNWKELVGKAKSGTLSPAEYTTGTFTISNMGMFGVTQFGSLLPVGQGGILAVGATQDMVVPDNAAVLGMKKVRKMTVTLTADHRQIYGSDAAMFLKTLKNIMENEVSKLGQ